MTPSEVITALEKALQAGPTPGEWTIPHFAEMGNCQCGYVFSDAQSGMGSICTVTWGGEDETKEVASANAHLIAACSPLAIRTLLDAHASALRDAGRYRRLIAASQLEFPVAAIAFDPENDPIMKYGREQMDDFIDGLDVAAFPEYLRAALDDNTKGAAE